MSKTKTEKEINNSKKDKSASSLFGNILPGRKKHSKDEIPEEPIAAKEMKLKPEASKISKSSAKKEDNKSLSSNKNKDKSSSSKKPSKDKKIKEPISAKEKKPDLNPTLATSPDKKEKKSIIKTGIEKASELKDKGVVLATAVKTSTQDTLVGVGKKVDNLAQGSMEGLKKVGTFVFQSAKQTVSFVKEASGFVFTISEKDITANSEQEAKSSDYILILSMKEELSELKINTLHLTMHENGLEYDTLHPKEQIAVKGFIYNDQLGYKVNKNTTIEDLTSPENIHAFFNIYGFICKEGHFYKHTSLEETVEERAVSDPEILVERDAVNAILKADYLSKKNQESVSSDDLSDCPKDLPPEYKEEPVSTDDLSDCPKDLPPEYKEEPVSIDDLSDCPKDLPPEYKEVSDNSSENLKPQETIQLIKVEHIESTPVLGLQDIGFRDQKLSLVSNIDKLIKREKISIQKINPVQKATQESTLGQIEAEDDLEAKGNHTVSVQQEPDSAQPVIVQLEPEIEQSVSVQSEPEIELTVLVQQELKSEQTVLVQSEPEIELTVLVQPELKREQPVSVQSEPEIEHTVLVQSELKSEHPVLVQSESENDNSVLVQPEAMGEQPVSVQLESESGHTVLVQSEPMEEQPVLDRPEPESEHTVSVQSEPKGEKSILIQPEPNSEHIAKDEAKIVKQLMPIQQRYEFYSNSPNVGREHHFLIAGSDKKFIGIKEEFKHLQADHLKSKILEDFKTQIEGVSDQGFERLKATLLARNNPETKVLRETQRLGLTIFGIFGYETSSMEALKGMLAEREGLIVNNDKKEANKR
ncbi:MAG: hypothetical protein H0U57_02645 [Tatlockia sp.]|nr:hypothetical protein [Tatlockia sp.]